jgi:hypothetical protein
MKVFMSDPFQKKTIRFLKKLFTFAGTRNKKMQKGSMDMDTIKQMVRGIMTTRADEIDCAECFEQLDQFVELVLAGKSISDAMPLVQHHLDHCRDCKEEFEVLLKALRSIT